jgi:hypothetical protein
MHSGNTISPSRQGKFVLIGERLKIRPVEKQGVTSKEKQGVTSNIQTFAVIGRRIEAVDARPTSDEPSDNGSNSSGWAIKMTERVITKVCSIRFVIACIAQVVVAFFVLVGVHRFPAGTEIREH